MEWIEAGVCTVPVLKVTKFRSVQKSWRGVQPGRSRELTHALGNVSASTLRISFSCPSNLKTETRILLRRSCVIPVVLETPHILERHNLLAKLHQVIFVAQRNAQLGENNIPANTSSALIYTCSLVSETSYPRAWALQSIYTLP